MDCDCLETKKIGFFIQFHEFFEESYCNMKSFRHLCSDSDMNMNDIYQTIFRSKRNLLTSNDNDRIVNGSQIRGYRLKVAEKLSTKRVLHHHVVIELGSLIRITRSFEMLSVAILASL